MERKREEDRRYCPNCHYPIPTGGNFCAECGQKFTTGRVTVWELFRDLAESVFNIDSKIFRTLGALFLPGKLTVEYFKGRHRRYLPPLRLFFILTVIFFAVFGIMVNRAAQPVMQEMEERQLRDAYNAIFMDKVDSVGHELARQFPEEQRLSDMLDSLEKRLHDPGRDSLNIGYLRHKRGGTFEPKNLSIAKRDAISLTPEQISDKYGIEGFFNRFQVQQVLKINLEGGNFAQFALSNLVWMVLLMMPALALVLKLLYIRRRRYYVEHLVFSFHYHAFAFLLIALGILVGSDFLIKVNTGEGEARGLMDADLVSGVVYLWIFFYLYKAMRRVYGQGRFKTIVKFLFLNFAYLFIFTVFLTLFFVITALAF